MLSTRTDGKHFLISLDPTSKSFSNIYMVMRTLLSAYESEENTWVVDYDDFLLLKKKLDLLKITDGRTANIEAKKLMKYYQDVEAYDYSLKSGEFNDKVKSYLDGKIKSTLYEDQLTGVAYLLKHPRSLLMDGMGAGKSLQALAVAASVSDDQSKVLVIAPNSVLIDFEKEVYKHTHLIPLVIPSGRKKAVKYLKDRIRDNWNVLLVHPENLIGTKDDNESPLTQVIKGTPFKTIIIDEFHLYKNTDTKRAKCLISIVNCVRDSEGKPPRVHPMTGTLISETPVNAYLALKIAGIGNLPTLAKFEKYFTIVKKLKVKRQDPRGKIYFIEVPKVVGYKNLDVLKARLSRCSIRRTKEDLKGFPEKTVQNRTVLLTGRQKTLYKDLSKGLKDSLSERADLDHFFTVNSMGIRTLQLLNNPQLIGEDCPSAKYDEIDSLLEEILSDKDQKVIIWTEYRKAVDLVYDRWNEKYGVLKLYGGVNVTKDLEKSFVHENSQRVVAAIPKKAGTGVDFLARARTSIFIERPRSYTLLNQAIDRIHRRISTDKEMSKIDKIRAEPATIIFLEAKGSVDEMIREQLIDKDDMSKAATPTISKKDVEKYLGATI